MGVFVACLGAIYIKTFEDKKIVWFVDANVAGSLGNFLSIVIFTEIYFYLAGSLTNYENHRTITVLTNWFIFQLWRPIFLQKHHLVDVTGIYHMFCIYL